MDSGLRSLRGGNARGADGGLQLRFNALLDQVNDLLLGVARLQLCGNTVLDDFCDLCLRKRHVILHRRNVSTERAIRRQGVRAFANTTVWPILQNVGGLFAEALITTDTNDLPVGEDLNDDRNMSGCLGFRVVIEQNCVSHLWIAVAHLAIYAEAPGCRGQLACMKRACLIPYPFGEVGAPFFCCMVMATARKIVTTIDLVGTASHVTKFFSGDCGNPGPDCACHLYPPFTHSLFYLDLTVASRQASGCHGLITNDA